MKKIIFLAFLSASFMSAQQLSTTSGTVTIKSGASMNVSGLILNPDADHHFRPVLILLFFEYYLQCS